MSTSPKDLFKRYTTPPTPTHDAVQKWARKEGWVPPWDREEQNMLAGKKSGLRRAQRAKLRLSIVQLAYAELDPSYKHEPFSDETIGALQRGYLFHLGKGDGGASSRRPLTEAESDAIEGEFCSLMGKLMEGRVAPTEIRLSENDFEAFQDAAFSLSNKLMAKGEGPRLSHLTDDELDLKISVVLAISDLSEAERHALQKVSPSTLRKCLIKLSVESPRRIGGSR
jgi:hypothetical protein